VYRGNVAGGEEFSTSLARILGLVDGTRITRDTVTLVLDKGGTPLANTVELAPHRSSRPTGYETGGSFG
jgi:hypothetical protein